jgi:formate C-acetyltransferase
MYPYYRKDIASGLLTRESAQELLECLWIKMTNVMWFNGEMDAYFFPGYVPFQNLTVGGLDRETGKDATNELSYLCIDALMETRTTQPTLSVILHENSPEKFKLKVAELVALGLGHPSIFNFETLKTMAMRMGYPEKEAMDVAVMGCVEPVGAGVQYGHSGGSFLNAPMCLEFVFTNGMKRVPDQAGSGKRLGLATGDVTDIHTFEDFKALVMRQMDEQIRVAHIGDLYAEQVLAEYFPNPFQSLLTRDCLSIGKDVTQGAARVNVGPAVDMLGLADLVDSLAAVKTLVFEEKKISLEELSKAMAVDFKGYEILRQMLINKAPKYGNDVDEVDALAVEVLDAFGAKVEEYRGFRGNRNMGLNAPASVNIPLGFTVGALPSGRRAAEPLADGVSPAPGRDKEGPSAVIKSITKLNHCSLTLGTLVNLWFSGDFLRQMNGKKRFVDLLDVFHRHRGHHLQVNSISKGILRKAQKEPEKYPTLMVRVAGYSAYFIDLSESLQEHIISRTEHPI